ncbi:MAG: alginate O-acetyltransferase AlgX-related protein [bacterium]
MWLVLAAAEVYHLFDPFTYPYPPGRRPLGRPTPYRRLQHETLTGDEGGDLTRMLGFRLGTGLFAVPRGDIEVWTDRRGYRNRPGILDAYCPVVVTGDSFMDQGLTNEDTPAGVLSELLGVPVYDHTYMARGPAEGIDRFLASPHFRARPPRVVVWGFVERSAHGARFSPYAPPEPEPPPSLRATVADVWRRLRMPASKRESYKAFWTAYRDKWSMVIPHANAVRAEMTYRLAGELITDSVIVGERPNGEFALFLRGGLRILSRTPKQRRLGKAARCLVSYDAECRRRGIHLVMLLIPDKAHVYPHWLPPEHSPDIPQPDALTALERRLTARGVHVVNVLPAFRAHAGPDQPLLYYPDDTHWNEHGIRVAMEAVAQSLRARDDLRLE